MISQQFSRIINLLPEPVLLLTSDGRIAGSNRAAAQQFGVASLVQQSLLNYVDTPTAQVEQFLRACVRSSRFIPGSLSVHTAANGPVVYRCDGANVRPAGNEGPALILIRLRPQKSASNAFVALNAKIKELHKEITERRRAEQRLVAINQCFLEFTSDFNANIERLVSACGAFMNASWVTYERFAGDLVYPEVIWNGPAAMAVERTLEGQLCEQVARQASRDVVVWRAGFGDSYSKTDRAVTELGVATYIGKAVVEEHQVAGSLNLYFQGDVHFGDSERRVLEIFASAIGVEEERKAAEQELRRYAEDLLETRDALETRTAQLMSQRSELELARQAADAANLAKGVFLATMSHEIRTPMNAIIGFMEILTISGLTAEQLDYARTIQSATDTLLRVINDVLDLSKLEVDKLEVEVIDFNLVSVVEEVGAIFAQSAQSKGLELHIDIDPHIPTRLCGDPLRLRQVLGNLLSNAIKFTEEGEVLLSVTEECGTGGAQQPDAQADDSVLVCFAVSDTGIGISKEGQQRLFDSFTQVDASTTRRYGGTGLGLAICKRLVELMGGSITAESALQRGTRFSFTVRFTRQAADSVAESDEGQLTGLRVLIVDDSATSRRVLEQHIRRLGAELSLMARGSEALELMRSRAARGEPYEVALVDVDLPDMGGIELARAIKSEPALAGAYLVILSSVGERFSEGVLGAANAESSLTKPIKREQLLHVLRRAICRDSDSPKAAAQRPQVTHYDDDFKNLRILVIEDNPINQKIALAQLKQLGGTANIAANGRIALDMLAEKTYDMLLMDCEMPELDGYTTSRIIREREGQNQHVPIIAMTAHAMEDAQRRCIEAGMNDYISKPFSIGHLKEALLRQLRRLAV